MMSRIGLTVYGPEVAKSGLTNSLDDFIRHQSELGIAERFFSIHTRTSINSFYSLTGSTGGKHWPLVLDLFDMRPACVTVWTGHDALKKLQTLKGNTQPARAAPGTVRSRFFCDNPVTNLIHVSDSDSVMALEMKILRERFIGRDESCWKGLNSGHVSHSSLRVLLAVLGEARAYEIVPVNDRDDNAVANALAAFDRAEILAHKSGLRTVVHDYFAGERDSVEELIKIRCDVSAWDRLLLKAGLHAMPHWGPLMRRAPIAQTGTSA